jgi:lipopolysaccharide heptosyltransferase II
VAAGGTDRISADEPPRVFGPPPWDWARVERVLLVRLRSIGDAVLATPAIHALRRMLPDARIDLLLEDWVAPLFDGPREASSIVSVQRGKLRARLALAHKLRATRYDVVFDLHGGTTASLLAFASGAPRRVGYRHYRLSRLLTHRAPSPASLWGRTELHSVEQQLGLLGFVGVPVSDCPPTQLAPSHAAEQAIAARLAASGLAAHDRLALVHPAAAFESKRWSTDGFARVVERLHERGLSPIAIAARHEAGMLSVLRQMTRVPVTTFAELPLPEVVALAARSRVFVGNDSGIAHIAAAVRTPVVVIFGSSNTAHWRPWTQAPAEVVQHVVPCGPCPGYTCAEAQQFACVRGVQIQEVLAAVERVLAQGSAAGK